MQEELLIIECKRGNHFAQRQLYEQHVKRVFLILMRYVEDVQTAEELTADCFVKCFNKIGTFEYRGEGSFYAWLKKIAINEYLSFARKKKIVYEDEETVAKVIAAPVNDAVSKMRYDEILGAIRRLPEGYRTVFNLYAIEGYTHSEIAVQLNITEETSRSQLYKARMALQKTVKR